MSHCYTTIIILYSTLAASSGLADNNSTTNNDNNNKKKKSNNNINHHNNTNNTNNNGNNINNNNNNNNNNNRACGDVFVPPPPCERHARPSRSANAAYAHCSAKFYVKDHHQAGLFTEILLTIPDLCVSSLRRGHVNLLCIVPMLTDDPRRESKGLRRYRVCISQC